MHSPERTPRARCITCGLLLMALACSGDDELGTPAAVSDAGMPPSGSAVPERDGGPTPTLPARDAAAPDAEPPVSSPTDAGPMVDATDVGAPDAGGTPDELAALGWELVWADEFDDSQIDGERWTHAVDCWGGGNNEDQCYVADTKNSFVEDGALHIVAIDDAPSGAVGGPDDDPNVVTRGHSSARLLSRAAGDWTYGRVEVRARLPFGRGIWPAIWMLPTDSVYGGWARSGEIDIMEAVNLKAQGAEENRIHGTLHYGDSWPGNVSSGTSYDPPTDVTESFHTYAIEWEREEIRWFVDDVHYATQNTWYSAGNDYPAPFDQRFHLLLNLAVGGNWPGPPDATTSFPQELTVEYVRVYACGRDPGTGEGCATRDPTVVPLDGIAGP